MFRRFHARGLSVLGAAVVVGSLSAAVSGMSTATADAADFYTVPSPLPAGNPGDIIRAEPQTVATAPLVPLPGATAQRIMYRSTDTAGKPVAITGTVITPTAPWSGPGQRPIVGFAVGTQGVANPCAPSHQLTDGTEYEMAQIVPLLQQGYGVAVTDYLGVGTTEPKTYINRADQAHAVLDSVRAAQRLPQDNLPPNGPVLIWGYSQGGEGSAAALELQSGYAPELQILGGYAGAIPSDILAATQNVDAGPYAGFLGNLIVGLDAAYPDRGLLNQLNGAGKQFADQVATSLCTAQALATHPFLDSTTLFTDQRSLAAHLSDPAWQDPIADQRVGHTRPAAPVLVMTSLYDDVVPTPVTRQVAADWCDVGATVEYATSPVPTHLGGAAADLPQGLAWLADRVNNQPAPTNCGTF